MIELEDGTVIDADTWSRIRRAIARRAQEKAERRGRPNKIVSEDGVTIKVGNLQIRDDIQPDTQPNENYTEGKYKGWTIRVWAEDGVYCCNYFRGEIVRYLEVLQENVSDENAVFKMAEENIRHE